MDSIQMEIEKYYDNFLSYKLISKNLRGEILSPLLYF